jgi:hypothetical protein
MAAMHALCASVDGAMAATVPPRQASVAAAMHADSEGVDAKAPSLAKHAV